MTPNLLTHFADLLWAKWA